MNDSPPANRAESKVIGRASWVVLYAALDALIGHVPSVIVESNFQRGYAEPELKPRLEQCDGILIHCVADRNTILDRIRARQHDPARHAGHFDQDAIPGTLRLLDADGYRLDDLDIPVIEVDTSDGYQPELAQILRSIASGDRS